MSSSQALLASYGGASITGLYYKTITGANNTAANYQFTNIDIGTAQSDRYVIVAAAAPWASAQTVITINSSTANLIVTRNGVTVPAAMYGLNVPSGTTCTVNVYSNNGTNAGRVALAVYTLYGHGTTPTVSSSQTNGTSTNTASITLTTTSGGVVVLFNRYSNTTGNTTADTTWYSNVTRDGFLSGAIQGNVSAATCASNLNITSAGSTTYTANVQAPSVSAQVLVGAAFQ